MVSFLITYSYWQIQADVMVAHCFAYVLEVACDVLWHNIYVYVI